jgi:hypothetical protein
MDTALAEYHAEQQKDSKRQGLCVIAAIYKVNHSTLGCLYLNSNKNIDEFNKGKCLLSGPKSKKLIEFVLQCTDQGFPLMNRCLEETVNKILAVKYSSKNRSVGKNWVSRFICCYGDLLKTQWSLTLDMKQAWAVNQTNLDHYFQMMHEVLTTNNIKPNNMYGMDETCVQLGCAVTSCVIGCAGMKQQHTMRDGDCKNVMVIKTIQANGTALVPTVVFHRKNFMTKWGKVNLLHVLYIMLLSLD